MGVALVAGSSHTTVMIVHQRPSSQHDVCRLAPPESVCACVRLCVCACVCDTRLRLSGCQWAISWPSASQWCATLCEPVRLGLCWAMCSSQSRSSCLCVLLTLTKSQLLHSIHNTGSGWRGDLCWCRAMCSTAARGGSTQEHCPCSTDVDKYLINSDDLQPLCRQSLSSTPTTLMPH